jgi:hypothetical protein
MTKKELLENPIFKQAAEDQEVMIESMGYHKPRRVRFGKTPRTGDKMVVIISNI